MSGSMTASPGTVRVRMYRQGLGDCFLLAFARDDGSPLYVLIDCGVIMGTPSPVPTMQRVAEDIAQATGGTIDIVACTHEHWDHLSGFIQAGQVFQQKLTFDTLWLAWTEDPADELGTRLHKEFDKQVAHLRMAVSRAANAESVAQIAGLVDFFGPLSAAAVGDTATALKQVHSWAKRVEYHRPCEDPLALPGVSGVRVYVLGPPHDETALKRTNPSRKGEEVELASKSYDTANAFWLAAGDPAYLTSDEQEKLARSYPFESRLRIPRDDHQVAPFFRQRYFAAGEEWRRIDDDWLDGASELALAMDNYTNNTSLVLAFELVSSGKVLLFAADAQVGNWESWQQCKWTVAAPDGSSHPLDANDLLHRTVLYKVGHHGSHNATVWEQGLALMDSEELVAMLPVNEQVAHDIKHWTKMPFVPLVNRLQERTKGRLLRVDAGLPAARPADANPDEWQAFLARCTAPSDLCVECVVS